MRIDIVSDGSPVFTEIKVDGKSADVKRLEIIVQAADAPIARLHILEKNPDVAGGFTVRVVEGTVSLSPFAAHGHAECTSDIDPGRRAYERYYAHCGGLAWDGRRCPTWDNLTSTVQDHWRAVPDVA